MRCRSPWALRISPIPLTISISWNVSSSISKLIKPHTSKTWTIRNRFKTQLVRESECVACTVLLVLASKSCHMFYVFHVNTVAWFGRPCLCAVRLMTCELRPDIPWWRVQNLSGNAIPASTGATTEKGTDYPRQVIAKEAKNWANVGEITIPSTIICISCYSCWSVVFKCLLFSVAPYRRTANAKHMVEPWWPFKDLVDIWRQGIRRIVIPPGSGEPHIDASQRQAVCIHYHWIERRQYFNNVLYILNSLPIENNLSPYKFAEQSG
jgi:hypothetical protein